MRPQNMFYYESVEDALSLAIRLGVGLAQNHGFVDGNKRTGLVAMIGGGEDDATAFDFARELGGWSSAVAVMPEGCEV